MALVLIAFWPVPALAQGVCSGVQVGAQVVIDSPKAGAVTTPFTVRGHVSSTLPVSEVYLYIDGGVASSHTYSASTSLPFEFSIGPSQAGPGSHSLKAVACGAGLGLVRGESGTVTVEVQRPPTTTSGSPPTTPPQPTTTLAATVTTVSAIGSVPSSSSTTKPASKKEQHSVVVPDLPGPPTPGNDNLDETVADAPVDRPITLTEDNGGGHRAPLWVGLVVGLSGATGLALSGLLRRRSTPGDEPPDGQGPVAVEPGTHARSPAVSVSGPSRARG